MYNSARFQELMTQGYALSNKLHFKQFNENEFRRWIEDCERLLAACEPEPYFPLNPDPSTIEEIVMLLVRVSGEISRGHTQYMGVL